MRHRRRLKRPLPNPTDAHNGSLGSQVLHMRWLSVFRPLQSSNQNIISRVFIHILPRLLAMKRPQYEKDRHRLVERKKGQKKPLLPLNICKLSRLHKHYLSSEDRNFLPLAELLTVHPPQRAAKTNARFSLSFSLSLSLSFALSLLSRKV